MAEPLALVTGACGFMGTHMLEVLVESGWRVRATDVPAAWAADDLRTGRFPSVARRLGVEIVPADVTRPETLAGLGDGVDVVFHIAAVFSYGAPWEVLRRVNVEGTENLLRALPVERLGRFVVWGAGGVYGFPEDPARPIVESDPPAPGNNYLRSKHLQEQLVMRWGRERGLAWTSIRPTTVYGPRAVYGGGELLLGAARMKVLAAPASFTSHIPFIHVRDVCRAALHLATHEGARGEVYNFNDDTVMTVVEYLRYVAELMGRPTVTLPPVPVDALRTALVAAARASDGVARRIGRRSPLEADKLDYLGRDLRYANDKLKATGFRFRYPDAREGIRDTLAWYAREGWLEQAPRGADRHRYETLARAPDDELERVFRGGVRPPDDALAGWEFRGYNTLPVTQVLGFRKFKKGFYRDARGLAGYNVQIKPSALGEPWIPRLRGGRPVLHGFYRVVPGDGEYPHSQLIDYSLGDNPAWDPSRLLRDYLVQPYPDDPDLLLGKAYLALGPARPAVSYFVLARDCPGVVP